MRVLIVLGDRHTGGGSVITGSPDTDIDGKPVARVGDKAVCPLHKGVFPIVTGDSTLIVDGQAAARQGDKLACGCSLIPGQQSRAWVEAGGSKSSLGGAITTAAIGAASPPHSSMREKKETFAENPAVCEECLLAAAKHAAAYLER